jgi:hypothetical protein
MSYAPRSARSIAVAFGLLFAATPEAHTQSAPAPDTAKKNSWEVLFSSGALVPTGAQRKSIKDAPMSTGQVSYVIASRFAVTTMVGWARSRDLLAEGAPGLSVFTYDLGLEARGGRRGGDAWGFTPIYGVGAGARSLDHRGTNLRTTHAPTGYASLGGELAFGRARVRLEARDYLTRMTPLTSGSTREMRNDVTILAGFRLAAKRATTN